jgi:hypothetical protein
MAIAPGFEIGTSFDKGTAVMDALRRVIRITENWSAIAKAVEPKMIPIIRSELAVSYGNSGLGVKSGRLYKALVTLATIKVNEQGITAYIAKDQNAENDRVYHQFGSIVNGAVYGVGTGRKRSSSLVKSRTKIKSAERGGKVVGGGVTVKAPWRGGSPFDFSSDQAERLAKIYVQLVNAEIEKIK